VKEAAAEAVREECRAFAALLARLCRERAAAVLVATHNEQLARTCDRVLLLADGRLHE
jgi:predicted ABC-type transport system involved in lysophospholipase L1 biosynthesis ATPase subunit